VKRITAVIMIILCLFAGVRASAVSEDSKAYFDITSLQIMIGDENGDLKFNDELTRAEFATIMTRLLRYDSLSMPFGEMAGFEDVKPDDWFFNQVGVMYAVGIMNGVSSNRFAPMESVTYEQAVKTLVVALGYGIQAMEKGGYPIGYLVVGEAIGLTQGVQMDSDFTRGDLMQLLYNSLDINMTVTVYGGTEMYRIEQGKTLRNLYENTVENAVVKTEWGLVTANADTWLTAPNSSLKENEVEIDDVRYRVGDTAASDYIGQMVEFYVLDEDGVKTLLGIRATSDNTVTDIDFENITNVSLSKIDYVQGERTDEIFISGAKIVRNGRLVLTPEVSDLLVSKGNIRTVDNDGDDIANVVFVNDFVNVRVKEVRDNTIEFAAGDLLNNARFFHIDPEDSDVRYNVFDGKGERITPTDIPTDSILSISTDADKQVYTIVVSSQTIEGTVDEISDDGIMIDGEKYPRYRGELVAISPGDTGTAYLDYKGYVAAFNPLEKTEKYAYLLAADPGEGIAGIPKVKMLVGSVVRFEYEKNEQNLDDTNLIPVIICENKGVEILEVANTLSKDNMVYKSSESKMSALIPGLYAYEINDEGKLTKLTSAQLYGGGTNMKYNAYDKTFAGNFWREPFAIDENTVTINLPTNVDVADRDYLVPLKISNTEENITFYTEGYDHDGDTEKVKAVIFYDIMRADEVFNIEKIKVGMVEKVTQVLGDDGEHIKKISMVTKAGQAEYLAKLVPGRNDILNRIKAGDLIYYETDLMGKLCNAEIIQSFASGVGSWNGIDGVYGYVTDIEYDKIDNSTGDLVARLKMDTSRGGYQVDIPQRNTPPIFVYDRAKREISLSSLSAIFPGNSSETFYYTDSACVICK